MLRGLLLMLCALAVTAPVAGAAEDEIFVDPGSPTGKEYALPIDSARKQAAGDARRSSSGTKPPPLFGEGVDDRSAGGSGTGDPGGGGGAGGAGGRDGTASAGGGRKAGGSGKAGAQHAESDGGTPVATRAQAASPDGGMGTVAIIGAGAGVLLLGGAIGLILRRRSARTT